MTLPEISFCETDSEKTEAAVISIYERLTETTLYPGDPVRLFLEALAAVVIQQRFLIDFSAKQNLVAYASGDYLDHLGALMDTPRLQESPARVQVRFSLDAPLAFAVAIPKETRVTPDRNIFFATESATEIPAGETSVDVWASCQTDGADGNGFLVGQINKLVDPVSYVARASNVTASSGGADVETDTRYRKRILAAPRSFSVAGPAGAYIHWAKTAHQEIVDVSVRSPSPGVVEVRPLMLNGALPDHAILAAVEDIFADNQIRPLTDQVVVLAPEPVNYDLTVDYYIAREQAAVSGQIRTAVAKAVQEFQTWQSEKLGRDINPSELAKRMITAGAKRVVTASPVFQVLAVYQVARLGTVTLNYGGLEDG